MDMLAGDGKRSTKGQLPPEVAALAMISAATSFADLAQGLALYHRAIQARLDRIREISEELGEVVPGRLYPKGLCDTLEQDDEQAYRDLEI